MSRGLSFSGDLGDTEALACAVWPCDGPGDSVEAESDGVLVSEGHVVREVGANGRDRFRNLGKCLFCVSQHAHPLSQTSA